MLTRILLALRTAGERKRLRQILDGIPDVLVEVPRSRSPRWDRLARKSADLLLVSRSIIPDPVDVHIATLRQIPEAPQVLVLADGEGSEDRAQLLAADCCAVLDSSLDDDLLQEALGTVVSRQREEALARLEPPQALDEPRLTDFVSESVSMQTFMGIVSRVVHSDSTLLVVGETGVGKERLAQAIHVEGPRSEGPFIAVNCGAIPEALLESELFGHREGAFTGATRARRGWFELAHRGTIFLDEIGEMPFHLQVKLLRVLQSREVVPVGAERATPIDVRVMAATNRDLEQAAREKEFRLDLYYRLSVITLEIPPLRERREDIPVLVEKYVRYFQSRFRTTVDHFSDDAVAAMTRYDWPGNVRELVNVIERALLLCPGEAVGLADIPETIAGCAGDRSPRRRSLRLGAQGWTSRPLREVRAEFVAELERLYLEDLLRETSGRLDEAARRAGMNVRNLFEKMRRHGLRKESFRIGPGSSADD